MTVELAWHNGLSEIRSTIGCGGEEHLIVWREGELYAEGHDLEAERALVALGSEPCACLAALDGWSMRFQMPELLRHGQELDLKGVVEANLTNLTTLLGHILTASSSGSGNPSALSAARARLDQDVERNRAIKALLGLDPAIIELARGDLVHQHIVAMRAGGITPADRMELEQFISWKLTPLMDRSIRAWRRLDPGSLLTTECWMGAPGSPPVIFGWVSHHGGLAGLTVGPEWLLEVYLRGFALVDECLVIAVLRSGRDGDWHDVLAVRWEPGWDSVSVSSRYGMRAERIDRYFADRWTPKVAQALVFRSADGWHLSWSAGPGEKV